MNIDLSPKEFEALALQAAAVIVEQLGSISDSAVRTPVPLDLREKLLSAPLPEEGSSPKVLLERVRRELMPYPMGNASPRFFAWVNSPPAPMGILGDMLAAAINPSVAGGDHAATYVEHSVLSWLKQLVGYPSQAGGLLTSGGSAANLVCLGAMRQAASGGTVRELGLSQAEAPLIIYTSDQGHSCIAKAAEILGFGSKHVRKIASDEEFRLELTELRRAIAADRAAGMRPVCVAASAGTVNTGAIDPLKDIAELCQQEGLWFHIDGAYGGVGAAAEEVRALYAGMERADSVAIDPHKWLYIPIECGCALVRDKDLLKESFSMVPEYLRDDAEMPWFAEFGTQQTRGFRALKLWLVLQHVGAAEYRRLIGKDIRLSRTLQEEIANREDFTLCSKGPLSITCFQYTPPGVEDVEDVEALNRRLLDIVQKEGRVYLTSTRLRDTYVLRACIVNFRTTEADVRFLLEAVAEAGQRAV